MEARIVEKGAFTATGLAREFDCGNRDQIPRLWDEFEVRHQEIGGAVGGHALGLCFDAVPEGSFTYMAAVETEAQASAPEGMCTRDVPARTYAVFTVELKGDQPIGEVFSRAHGLIRQSWLPKSGYRLVAAPDFELYDDRFDPETLIGEVDLYIPVASV